MVATGHGEDLRCHLVKAQIGKGAIHVAVEEVAHVADEITPPCGGLGDTGLFVPIAVAMIRRAPSRVRAFFSTTWACPAGAASCA